MHRYREMFLVAGDYTFNELKVQRVTARTKSSNNKVLNVLVSRLGFASRGG